MYPVIAASAPPIGYGFTAKQIARSLLVLGPFAIFTQLVCYPWLSKRVSYVSSWRISSVMFLFIYGIFPFVPGPQTAPAWLEWTCLLLALSVRIAGLVIGYTSIAVLVSLLRCLSTFSLLLQRASGLFTDKRTRHSGH